jgi:chemotaxis protein CheX
MESVKQKMFEDDLGITIRQSVDETATAFFIDDCGIKPGPVVVKDSDEPYKPPEADLTAMVGFSGQVEGGVHLSSPMHVALGLASAFMGEPVEESSGDLTDAFGELANIIAGAVEGHISEEILLTPPMVVRGAANGIEYTKKLKSTKCYFIRVLKLALSHRKHTHPIAHMGRFF